MDIQSLTLYLFGIGAVCILGAWLTDRQIDGMKDSFNDSPVTRRLRVGMVFARKVAMFLGFTLFGLAIVLVVLGL